MNVIVAWRWLSVVLRRMNGSGGSAFSGSLLRNDSPSVIVNECWEREDLYLFFFSPALSLCRAAALSFLSHLTLALCFLSMPLSLCVLRAGSSHVTASLELLEWGMGEREEGGREVGKEGGGKGGWTDSQPGLWGGEGILQVARMSQSIVYWAT